MKVEIFKTWEKFLETFDITPLFLDEGEELPLKELFDTDEVSNYEGWEDFFGLPKPLPPQGWVVSPKGDPTRAIILEEALPRLLRKEGWRLVVVE